MNYDYTHDYIANTIMCKYDAYRERENNYNKGVKALVRTIDRALKNKTACVAKGLPEGMCIDTNRVARDGIRRTYSDRRHDVWRVPLMDGRLIDIVFSQEDVKNYVIDGFNAIKAPSDRRLVCHIGFSECEETSLRWWESCVAWKHNNELIAIDRHGHYADNIYRYSMTEVLYALHMGLLVCPIYNDPLTWVDGVQLDL